MPGDRQGEPEDMKQLKDSILCPSTGAFEVTYPL